MTTQSAYLLTSALCVLIGCGDDATTPEPVEASRAFTASTTVESDETSSHNISTNILQFPRICAACPLLQKCPVRFADGWNQVTIEAKQVRPINRRRKEKTTEFRDEYRLRSGIEATNSLLKRVTGLNRLRVRGRPAVFSSILLKVAGWNLLRAASVRSLLAKLAKGGQTGQSALFFATSYGRLVASSGFLVA